MGTNFSRSKRISVFQTQEFNHNDSILAKGKYNIVYWLLDQQDSIAWAKISIVCSVRSWNIDLLDQHPSLLNNYL